MVQMVVFVEFPDEQPPDREAVRQAVAAGVGTEVILDTGGSLPGSAACDLVLARKSESVAITYDASPCRIRVEVDQPPSYFQWAIVAALQSLGGKPTRPPPSFAQKKLDELKWVERSWFVRRLLGGD